MHTLSVSQHAAQRVPRGAPNKRKLVHGFTIVELLIVIVVIAILVAISIVAYIGIQESARDSQRQQDMNTITKALEMYYIDNGRYPSSTGGSTTINSGWTTTSDGSWETLRSQLSPKYISELPEDPVSTPGISVINGTENSFNYAYYTVGSVGYCGKTNGQMYLLVYRNESGKVTNTTDGTCATNPVGYYGAPKSSNIRVVR